MELRVRDKLIATGFRVHKGRSAIQCEFDPVAQNYPVLTPDIILSGTKVCVEVDARPTHADSEKDRRRNALLAGVGWTTVRLRLGGLEPLGDYDVASESEGVTAAAISALGDAVSEAIEGVPGHVRRVAKTPTTRKSPQSPLRAIAAHKYWDAAYYCSWSSHRLVIMAEGRYLAGRGEYSDVDYIRALPLYGTPRARWRAILAPILEETTSFTPVSRFPWGDKIWGGQCAPRASLSSKFNAGGSAWEMTTNADGADRFDENGLLAGDQRLLTLHPGAREFGWSISDVSFLAGRAGPYQKLKLFRDDTSG